MTATRNIDRLGALMLSLSTLALVWVAAFVALTLLWQTPTLTKMVLTPGEARAGGPLRVRMEYCKPRDRVPVAVRWSLQNEVSIVLPDVFFALPRGCSTKTVEVPLSAHVIPGRYKLQVEVVYQPWPWLTETIVRESAPFEVKRPEVKR